MSGELLKPKDVAERLGVDVSTISKWIKHEGLPAYGLSPRSRWLDWDEVVAWLKRRRVGRNQRPDASLFLDPPASRGIVLDLPPR